MKSYQQFFAEMKRRRVFRVMGAYGAAAFVVLQAGELLVNTFQLSPQIQTTIGFLAILGFPIAIVLAWAFKLTPDGVERTGEAQVGELEEIATAPASARWPSGLLALFGTAALVAGIWLSLGARRATDLPDTGAASDVRLAFVDPSVDPRPSLAVLPFADLSPQGDQAYFSDGMTEEILNVLAKIRDLRVAARTSVFALRDRELTARQWGDTLHVQYFVEGSVRKSGDMVRVTAQLIDTSDGSHLWTDNFDRPLANIFQIQSEIAEAIAEQLRVPLGLGDAADLVRPTADLEAYDLYLAGRAQMRRRGSGVTEAVTLFKAAIALDSTWAPAWAGLAESQALIPYHTSARDSAGWAHNLEAAEAAARRALELDQDNASALVALGNVYRDRWEWAEAEDAYLRALADDPDNVEAYHQYAEFLYQVGRETEAYEAAKRALALDRSPIRLNVAGYIALDGGRINEGIALLEEGIRVDPECHVLTLRSNVRWGYMDLRRWEDWWDIHFEFIRQCGDLGEAFDELLAVWPAPGPPSENLDIGELPWLGNQGKARLAASFGQHELALEKLLEAYAERPPYGFHGRLLTRIFDPIRDDPRLQALLSKRGLAGIVPDRLPADSASAP